MARALIIGTSPSGEKLRAEIAVVSVVSEAPESKLGSPGGALASRTFIFVTLHKGKTSITYSVIPRTGDAQIQNIGMVQNTQHE